MTSSDDEDETVPRNVSDYEFVSGEDEPVSFGELPVLWNKETILDGNLQQIFVRGKTDDGLRSLYKEVKAWKFDLSCKTPDISVLTVEGHWIKLLKPRKAFEVIIRTVLITVHCLHFVKWNSQISHKVLWDNLTKRFRFDMRPSEDDLVDHASLIHEAVKRDEDLGNSKILSTFLKEKPKKRRACNEDPNPSFIVHDVSVSEDLKSDDASETEEADEDDCFDSVCAICDNGGRILLCEGKCMRSFHPTEEDGDDSICYSLGFTEEEFEALQNVDFYCKNCEYKQHQCFSCGKLGSSDESSGAEVFRCINGACGHFYHPDCVAKLLHPMDKMAAEELGRRIAAGEQFACPVHKCHVCNELEVRSDEKLQFAICRRCPRAYHRKCLPREIAFEKDVEEGRAEISRAWEGLIHNRILIYCSDHQIDPRFFTPLRNHIKFPGPEKKMSKLQRDTSQMDLSQDMTFASEDISGKRSYEKPLKIVQKVSSDAKGDVSRKRVDRLPLQGLSKKQKVGMNKKSLGNSNKSSTVEGKMSLGYRLFQAHYGLDSEPAKVSREERVHGEHEKNQNLMPTTKRINITATLDDDARKRILTLMKNVSSSITIEEIKRRHIAPSTHASSLKKEVENVTLGKVEGSVQAVHTALAKLDKGGSVQDAKEVCGNDLLVQVMKWKEKLKVYLAPFLHGMRYTSFGRHFTKMDKLQEIADMLHCYIQDGDMVVDFCCGSNDFSCLVKKKLDEVGKKCSYKNYDIVQPKNDFCYEKRDWMKVKTNELPEGSRLIMGLNPPFGVNASLANKFINKALEFKPKLLILIVPRETQRLDRKNSRYQYDLIWEDDQMLAGKSFYLPGSVDVNDKQIDDWNVSTPVLYLWSSPDWTRKHKAIAEKHGHPSRSNPTSEQIQVMQFSNQSPECHNLDKSENQVEVKHRDDQVKQDNESEEIRTHKEISPSGTKGDTSRGKLNNIAKKKNKRKRRSDKKAMEENPPPKRSALNPSLKVAEVSPRSDKKVVEEKFPPKPPAPNPSSKVADVIPEVVRQSSSHVHSGRERSLSAHPSPKVQHRCISDTYSSKNLGRQPHVPHGNDDYQQINDLVREYNHRGEASFPGRANIRTPSPGTGYGYRASAEQHMGYSEGRTSAATYRSYDRNYGSDVSYQSPAGDGPSQSSQRLEGWSPFPSPHIQMNPGAANFGYGGSRPTSAMQRYAPRLNDMDHGRMGAYSGPPPPDNILPYHSPGPRPGYQGGSLGFAPGPYRPYSHGSSGWLNE